MPGVPATAAGDGGRAGCSHDGAGWESSSMLRRPKLRCWRLLLSFCREKCCSCGKHRASSGQDRADAARDASHRSERLCQCPNPVGWLGGARLFGGCGLRGFRGSGGGDRCGDRDDRRCGVWGRAAAAETVDHPGESSDTEQREKPHVPQRDAALAGSPTRGSWRRACRSRWAPSTSIRPAQYNAVHHDFFSASRQVAMFMVNGCVPRPACGARNAAVHLAGSAGAVPASRATFARTRCCRPVSWPACSSFRGRSCCSRRMR